MTAVAPDRHDTRSAAGPPPPAAPNALTEVVVISDDRRFLAAWATSLHRLGTARSVHVDSAVPYRDIAAPGVDLVVVDAETLGGGRSVPGCVGPPSATGPETHLVVVGDPGRGAAVRAALTAGARGYLFGRVRTATQHAGVPVAAETPDDAGTAQVADINGVLCTLTEREVQIIRYTADGETNVEIAARLGLSPLTVKSHLSRIGRRLGTGDRAQMVLLALRSRAFP